MSYRKIYWEVKRDKKDDHSDYIQKTCNYISLHVTFVS